MFYYLMILINYAVLCTVNKKQLMIDKINIYAKESCNIHHSIKIIYLSNNYLNITNCPELMPNPYIVLLSCNCQHYVFSLSIGFVKFKFNLGCPTCAARYFLTTDSSILIEESNSLWLVSSKSTKG